MKSYTAGTNEDGVRLSRFVQNVASTLPTSMMYKAFRNKRIKVNGKKADADYRLHQGDFIELYINDEFFPEPQKATKKVARKGKAFARCKILYENENIALLYKPAHLLCHSDKTGDASLIDYFIDLLTERGEFTPSEQNTFRPALCNRLDRGTEGIVIAAKNYQALRDMNAIIRDDMLTKEYLTITIGRPPEGIHTAYLFHDDKTNKVKIQKKAAENYKQIITGVDVLENHHGFSLCKITLFTGRTHQIRAHLSFMGAPVLGDIKYGNRKANEKEGFKTQALCAWKVSIKDLPSENTLHALSGSSFEIPSPAIIDSFKKLSNEKTEKEALSYEHPNRK